MSQTEIERRILEVLTATLQQDDVPAGQRLDDAFQVIAAFRAARLKQPLSDLIGPAVQSGPFAGMAYLDRVSEGAFIPKLLGSYEAELHGVIETACFAGYDTVVNVGCAEGYYAVGLARRLSSARIHAFDIDARARHLCQQLAEMNDVADRMEIAGELNGSDFAKFGDGRTLVLCDIEGAEVELLDPDSYPALRQMDLLVEIHRVGDAWTSDLLFPRFAEIHTVSEIQPEPRLATRYPALAGLDEVDRFFALLERIEPTRWAFLTATVA
jgi:hypothetical protein